MGLGHLALRFSHVQWTAEDKFQCRCPGPTHDGDNSDLIVREKDGRIRLGCFGPKGCSVDSILAAAGLTDADLKLQTSPSLPPKPPAAAFSGNGSSSNGSAPANRVLAPIDIWRFRVAKIVEADCDQAHELTYRNTEPEALVDSATQNALTIIQQSGLMPPEQTDTELEVRNIASGVVQGYLDRYEQRLPETVPAREVVIWESADQAVISNEEYLSREAIVERLYYEQAASLTVGGKHEGKSNNTKTEGLAISAGEPVYDGRTTVQMPVVYAASDDEYATTRMGLLSMGWQRRRLPLILVRVKTQDAPEPEQILSQLARMAEKEGSRFVVLDMLFDFIRVQDENKYAQTRQAIGLIQTLADTIKGHVKATHHSPKWMPDAATAAKAALGSQGIVAKFSPIVLARKWAEDLYTIESTMTRDPRGQALKPLCIVRDEDGWARPAGEFKAWMKWRMYADRILALFEGEPEKSMSVAQVMDALELGRADMQNAMYQMCQPGKDGTPGVLERYHPGKGNKYLYRLYKKNLFS